jgi:transposase-like protein
MPKKSTGSRYTEEFKAEAVQLARSYREKSIPQLSRELGISDQTLRNWVKQAHRSTAENVRASQPKNARNYVGSVKR